MEDALKQKQEVLPAPGEIVAQAFARIRQLVLTRKAEVVCALLLLLMAVNLFASISRKSITNDEVVHIPAGYYHLVAGEFQLNNEHPPLIKLWAALPLLLIQPEEPEAPITEAENFMEKTWGFHERFWKMNQARFQTVSLWPRLMMVPLTLALGVAIFAFTRRLFGDAAAVIAVGLYVLEPTVLAHGRVVHTDVPSALMYLLFFFALYHYDQALNNDRTAGLKRALLLGVVCSLAVLTKFSMLIVFPVLAIYLIVQIIRVRRDQQQRRQLLYHGAVIAAVVLLLVNVAYYFQRPALEASDVRWVEMKSPAFLGFVTTFIRYVSKIIPTYYLFGVYNIELHNHYGHATSLLGQYGELGWWYYFPVAFALKTTVAFLLISVAGLVWAIWMLVTKRDKRFLWPIVPIAVYCAISLSSNINIGIRHFLPVYPFLFIAGGALLAQLLRARKRIGAVALVVLFTWMGVEAVRAFPNYIPYLNQLASRHPHWYYLSDSNVEWGDDVGDLAAYLKARGETKVRAALSGGWSTLARYDVEYLDMVSYPIDRKPDTRYVAIGAAFMNGSIIPGDENVIGRRSFERTNLFARFRDRKPEAVFGGSIYLFREEE